MFKSTVQVFITAVLTQFIGPQQEHHSQTCTEVDLHGFPWNSR